MISTRTQVRRTVYSDQIAPDEARFDHDRTFLSPASARLYASRRWSSVKDSDTGEHSARLCVFVEFHSIGGAKDSSLRWIAARNCTPTTPPFEEALHEQN